MCVSERGDVILKFIVKQLEDSECDEPFQQTKYLSNRGEDQIPSTYVKAGPET